MNLVESTLELAGLGFRVFPLKPSSKTPLTPNGCKNATGDPAVIRRYWTAHRRANIGLATGGSLMVLDIDVDKGGFETLGKLETEHGELPDTLCSRTGSGGKHIFFNLPPGVAVRNSEQKLGPGLDVRGEGGYVVVPPSVHISGAPYCWLAPLATPVSLAPPWLVRLLLLPKPNQLSVRYGSQRLTSLDVRIERARAYLARVPGAVSGAGGHRQTFLAATALVRGFGLAPDEALGVLFEDYNPRCIPPWSVDELRHKVESAQTDGGRFWGYLLRALRPHVRGDRIEGRRGKR